MNKAGGVVSGLVVVLALAGCGGGGSPSPQPAAEQPVGKYTTVEQLGKAISAATGAQKYARVTMQSNEPGSGTYVEGPDGTAIDVTISSQGQDLRMIVTNVAAYFQLPDSAAAQLGKPWLKVTADGTDAVSKLLGATMVSLRDGMNPGVTLTDAKDAAVMGPATAERVNGVTAVRYQVTVDLVRLAATVTDPVRKTATERAVQFGAKKRVVTVWVDERDLPVRLTTQTDDSTKPNDFTFNQWGTPAVVTPPSPDMVGTLPEN